MNRVLVLLILSFIAQSASYAFVPAEACNYLKDIKGLSMCKYSPETYGDNDYECRGTVRLVDGKNSLTYVVDGNPKVADELTLKLRVYNDTDKRVAHDELVNAANIIAKKINFALNKDITSRLKSGREGEWRFPDYKIEIDKDYFYKRTGYEITFTIEEIKY